MLGKPFFSLCQKLQEARTFEDVADLLSNQGPALVGADDMALWVFKGQSRVEHLYGHGERTRILRQRLDMITRHLPDHPLMTQVDFSKPGELGFTVSDYLDPETYRECEFNRRVLEGDSVEDSILGRLVTTSKRQTLLVACRPSGAFSSANREAFDVLLYTARAVLERIASGNLEYQVTQYLLTTRGDARNGFFILRSSGEVLPLNHDAVRMSERWWSQDEAFRELAPRLVEGLRSELDDAWLDPITSRLKRVQLDLGGGPMKLQAIQKIDGETILILPLRADGRQQGDDGECHAEAVLTRRQREIMDWISEGKTSAEVAIILDISPRTVEKHLEAVFQRLGVENRIGAVRRFLDLKSGHPV